MQIATVLSLIIRVFDVLASGLQLADNVRIKYGILSQQIKVFVDENRDPTQEEWAALDAITRGCHERIQNS